jgi:hypothetical protein
MNNPELIPPKELVIKVSHEAAEAFPENDDEDLNDTYNKRDQYLADYFTKWGADKELDASSECLSNRPFGYSLFGNNVSDEEFVKTFRNRRRPKNLQEQALEIVSSAKPMGSVLGLQYTLNYQEYGQLCEILKEINEQS